MGTCRNRWGSVVTLFLAVGTRLVIAAVPNDPDFSLQWGMQNVGQSVLDVIGTIGADIDAVAAWDIHSGGASVTVAMVGRGVDPHPEFADRLLEGFATVGDPYDSLDGCHYDTQLAGIIAAATDDGVGIAGLNGKANILPVRVMTGCNGGEVDVAEGIRAAADVGADIILVAVQSSPGAQVLADAVEYASQRDTLVIAPAGGNGAGVVLYPAAFETCLAVSATTNRDELSPFSNYGPQVDMAAPGRGIWSTWIGGNYAYVGDGRDASAAAAFVAGAAALVKSYNPGLTAAQLRQILLESADDLGSPGADVQFGAGRLNVRKALELAPPPPLRFEHVVEFPTVIPPGTTSTFPVRILAVTEPFFLGSPAVVRRVNGGDFVAYSLTPSTDDRFLVPLGPASCESTMEYYLVAAGIQGSIVFDPFDAPNTLHRAEVVVKQTLFADDFETDRGWTVEGGDNQSGRWSRVAPNGTAAQPGFDFSPDAGHQCFVTGQHFGGLDGSNDVDGGPVVLTSPVIDLPPASDVEVSYARWFFWSGIGGEDFLMVELSRDGGSTWTPVEMVRSTDHWVQRTLRLSEFPGLQGSRLQLRFSTSDSPSDSLTEAGVDEFHVWAIQCAALFGDIDADGDVDLEDYRRFHACFHGPRGQPADPACIDSDLNSDGRNDLRDFGPMQNAFVRPAP